MSGFCYNLPQVQPFLNSINSQQPNIKFTRGIEVDNRFNFLDVSAYKGENKFSFSVFKKSHPFVPVSLVL